MKNSPVPVPRIALAKNALPSQHGGTPMPEAPPPAVPLPAMEPPPSLELRDFSDRLPAVLVKELRQGLRTRMFIVPFLILHGVLVLSSMERGAGSTAFFWQCLTIMLVALLPMRNLSALNEERQSRTLETLLLTRLTPWRIVSGKWCATFALALLTVVSAIPYLLVRYLNGGSSFVQEGAALIVLLFISGALTAVFTGLSTIGSALARHTFGVLLIIFSWQYGSMALFQLLQSSVTSSEAGVIAALIVVSSWAGFFSLWHAAGTLAPSAANLTTPRRLTSLAAVLITLLIARAVPSAGDLIIAVLQVILFVSSMVETGDRQTWNPMVTAGLIRRGFPGRLAAYFLFPGWPTGVVFSLALWALVPLTLYSLMDWERYALAVACSFIPVCLGAPLLFRHYGGAALMFLILALAQVLATLGDALLPDQMRPALAILPSVWNRNFLPGMSLVWVAAAFLIAVIPLVKLGRRFSRESSL